MRIKVFSLYLDFPRASASSRVSGRLWPRVSGSRKARRPTMMAPPPMMTKGRKAATESRSAMVGASRAPTLAIVEHIPIAEFLIGVWNNSAANIGNKSIKYIIV